MISRANPNNRSGIKIAKTERITKMNNKEVSKQIKDLGAQIIDLFSKQNVPSITALLTLTEILAFFIIDQFPGEEEREEMLKFIEKLLRTRLEEDAKKSTN